MHLIKCGNYTVISPNGGSVPQNLMMRVGSVIAEKEADAIVFDYYKRIGGNKRHVYVFANKYSLTCRDVRFGYVVVKNELLDETSVQATLLNVLLAGGTIKEVHEPVGIVKNPAISLDDQDLIEYSNELFGSKFTFSDVMGHVSPSISVMGKTLCVIISSNNDLLRKAVNSVGVSVDGSKIDIFVAWYGNFEDCYIAHESNGLAVELFDPSKPFNFSEINNAIIEKYSSPYEYVLLMNDDVEIVNPGFLHNMVGVMENEEKAAVVGAPLIYPDITFQHAGVKLGDQLTLFEHVGKGQKFHSTFFPTREVSAVTFALVLIDAKVYRQYLLDERYPSDCNDIDFCYRVRCGGYQVWYTWGAEAFHLESATRKNDPTMRNNDSRRFFEENYSDLTKRFDLV